MSALLLPTDLKNIHAWKKYFADDAVDEYVYDKIDNLRDQLEFIEHWKERKIKAHKEIDEIPANILGKLLAKFLPFITHLPTGHGPGHLSRDLIHLTTILHDEYIQQQDPVEVLVGLLAGIFHDIGNAVVERYDEPNHFAGHAEVGAYLFGMLAKDILPENILKLTQFAIASHTNYLKDIVITKYPGTPQEKTKIRKPYQNALSNGAKQAHKIALWMTQATDRSDALSVPFIIRHILTKAMPTQDYSQDHFHVVRDNEEEDFMHQFMPIIRTQEYKNQLLTKKDKTSIVLEHFYIFYETTVDLSPYSQYDTPYFFSHIVATNSLDTARFIIATTARAETIEPFEREKLFDQFYRVCAIIEPAHNTGKTIQLLKKKFPLLSDSYQNHWAHGFKLLTTKLYPRWYKETKESIQTTPKFENAKLSTIIKDLHKRANHIIEAFSPDFLTKKETPDLIQLLEQT